MKTLQKNQVNLFSQNPSRALENNYAPPGGAPHQLGTPAIDSRLDTRTSAITWIIIIQINGVV